MKTTFNEEARNVIENTIKRKEKAKLTLLAACVKKVEALCRENGISWFAMGKLLTLCSTGKDDYMDEYDYDIGFLRKDYDAFLKKWKEAKKSSGLTLEEVYTYRGVVKQSTAYISNHRKVKMDEESLDLSVRLYLQPFDILPSDKKERESFIRKVSKEAGQINRLSLTYRFLRRDAQALPNSPFRMPRLVLDKFLTGTSMRRSGNEYRRLMSKYRDLPDPAYVGRIDQQVYEPVLYEDIMPLGQTKWKDITVMLPHHPDVLAVHPIKEERKRILAGRLAALKVFDDLCSDHGLSYVAIEDLAIICSHGGRVSDDDLEMPWIMGMMRSDYEKVLPLLEQCDDEICLLKSEPLYPSVCGEKIGFYRKGYARIFPWQKDGLVYIVPFDVLPSDYKKRRPFTEEVKKMAAEYNKRLRYEKGLSYKKTDNTLASWDQYQALQKKRCSFNGSTEDKDLIFTLIGPRMVVMPQMEIFPAAPTTIEGQPLYLPANPYFWFVKKDQDYTRYLAARREKVMEIVDRMAKEHQIRYFAMSNLLRGVVIYHDVMPRSDQRNMDIGLLRDDYDAFVDLLRDRAGDYGLTLTEYYDREGRYPLEVKYVTLKGQEYTQARVRFVPYDKVPEDYYLYQGLRDEIDPLNKDYKALIKYYNTNQSGPAAFPDTLTPEEIKKLEKTDPKELATRIDQLARSFNDDERTSTYKWIAFGQGKAITKAELFPMQRVKFRGLEVDCPRDTSIWQPVLDKELERQVSCIQRADLILLEEFDRLCREVGVGYFVCGGTMLGYMRHGGFIPWDDDVDVAMLRADYDRFMKEAGPHLKDRFFLQTRASDPNIPYLFSKLRLDDTEYITRYNEERNFHKGICLDIFPFDYLPEKEQERMDFVKEVRALAREHHIIARRQYPVPEEEIVPRNEQERRYIKEQKELLDKYWKTDLSKSQEAYLAAATRYNKVARKQNLQTVGSFVPSYTFIDLNDLLPYQRGRFENIEVSVPKRPDIFLEMQYGDYMKLPPRHQQVAHRLLRWKTWEDSGEASVGV